MGVVSAVTQSKNLRGKREREVPGRGFWMCRDVRHHALFWKLEN